MSVKELVGSWEDLFKDEFKQDYVRSIETRLAARKQYEQVKGDPFACFRNFNIKDVKVVYFVDDLQIDEDILEMYQSMGLFFFPRHLTWGEEVHHEWRQLTENILLKLVKQVPIVSFGNHKSVKHLVNTMSPYTMTIGRDWRLIKEYLTF